MTTATHEEVFQLAKDLGYIKPEFIISVNYQVENRERSEELLQLFSLHLIQKWLRETCGVIVLIECPYVGAMYEYIVRWHNIGFQEKCGIGFETFENALLEGVNAGLKTLKV